MITLNRILIAIVLIYFPLVTLGKTGSYLELLKTFLFISSLIGLGAIEVIESNKGKK